MPKSKRKAKPTGPRASWKGQLAFGLVTFPVQALNAIDRRESDIHFHQLHAGCHRRIRHQKVCPIHGEVRQDEIVSGYEYKKGRYVEIEPEELAGLRTERERALTIDAFIAPEVVDPLYFDGRMYYLLPDGAAAAEPYAVLVEAMKREERYAIGQLIFSGKEQLALLRPLDGVVHMAMLNYDEEIRPPEEMEVPKLPRHLGRKLQLARTLVRGWTDNDFEFTTYDDPYRERVQELIKAKVAGRELVAPPAEEEAPQVVSLMDALKQSLARRPQRRGKTRVPRKRRRTA